MGLIVNEKKTKYMNISATQKGQQTQNLNVEDKVFETVPSFKYLGHGIESEGRINQCVKDRIQAQNRAYAADYSMLKSKIIKSAVKMQIYRTMIRPIATCAETWTLTKSYKNLLRIFVSIMQKI